MKKLLDIKDDRVDVIKKIATERINETHMLFYCGKAKWIGDEIDEDEQSGNERIIDKVIHTIGKNGVGLKVTRFTYMESPLERKGILKELCVLWCCRDLRHFE